MPELPEVETMVRAFRPRLEGRCILKVTTTWPRSHLPSAVVVRRALAGRVITALGRRGKFIVFTLDDAGHLLLHLRMSGRLEWAADHPRRPNHVRTAWELSGGACLWLCDSRKFGRLTYTRDLAAATADLGPEPLDPAFTVRALGTALRSRRRQLKPLLLDQRVIAGLGNIYTDEALHRARLHPTTLSSRLSDADVRRLHRAMRDVLRLAIRKHGTSIDWIYPGGWMQRHLRVYGRTGQACRTCGATIAYLRIGQRGTHVCPVCQPVA